MSLLKFELKKVLAQRKYIWLVAIVLLVTSAILWQNLSHQEGMVDRALAEVEPLVNEVATLQRPLQDLLDNQGLNELQQHQYNSLQQMRMGLTRWRNAINQKQWSEVPLLQEAFLGNLQVYAGHQGMFSALDGADREVAMAKNSWMLEHNLPYEDELYPVSPSLMLKQTGGIFLGLLGIIVLLLFFGNSMTEEKEQYTVLTLKTQPLSRFQVLLAKYISLLMVMLLFIILVVAIGLVIPWQFGSGSLSFDYPQVLTSGEAFTIISTGEYLVRAIVLFFSAGSISFGISLLVSTWAKKSFTAYLLMAAVIGTGYFATAGIQSPFNPFYLLNFSQILASFAPGGEWRYLLSAGLWSAVLLMLTAVLSEQEISIGPGDNTKQPFAKGDTGGLPLMLARIWTFEWRKLLREGLLRQLAIFLLLFLVAGFLALNHQAQLRQQTYLEDLEQYSVYLAGNMEWMQQEVDMYQAEAEILAEVGIENYDSPLRRHLVYDSFEFQITQFQSAIDYLVELQAAISAALIGYQTGDWAAFHQYQLLDNRFHNREFSTGSWSTNLAEHVGRFTVAVSIEEKKLLMEHNIQPVFSGEFIVTIYPSWTGDLYERWGLEWEEENKKVDSSGLFSLYHALENYVYFLPMVLLLFLLGGGLAVEKGKRPTLRLLKTLPISEKQVFLSKILNTVVIVAIALLLMALVLVLMGTVVNRLGDWQYPLLHYNSVAAMNAPDYTGMEVHNIGYHFMTLGQYLLEGMVLLLALSWLFTAFANFLGLFIKKPLGVFGATLLIGGGGYWLGEQMLTKMKHLSPFTYLDIPKIVNGEMATILNNPGINVLTGTLIILATTVLLIFAGYLYLIVRDKKIRLLSKGGNANDLSS